jgi:Ca2+/Na+ antiporter
MHLVLIATMAQKHHQQEIGIVIGGVGALALVVAGVLGLMSMSRMVERTAIVVAGILLGAGFILQYFALHGGGK